MAHRITCKTLFDISATGVRGHFNAGRIPFTDDTGQMIQSQQDWERSRNQQRNWETMNQIISLRVLPDAITVPQLLPSKTKIWSFDFLIDNLASVETQEDPAGILASDADNVPMIINLDEDPGIKSWIVIKGKNVNTWFTVEEA